MTCAINLTSNTKGTYRPSNNNTVLLLDTDNKNVILHKFNIIFKIMLNFNNYNYLKLAEHNIASDPVNIIQSSDTALFILLV